MAIAPGIPVDLPAPPPIPVGSLIDSMAASPSQNSQDERWTSGISWAPHSCENGHVIDPCDMDSTDTLADAETVESEIPYGIGYGIRASTRGFQIVDYQGRSEDALNTVQSRLIEAEFWDGAFALADGNNNFYLAANGLDLAPSLGDAPGTAYKVQKGFAEIERVTVEALDGGQCMIHVPLDVVTYLGYIQAIEARGNVFYTKLGNIVIAGAGYSGSSPGGPNTSTVDTTRHTTYIYATGIANLWLSAPKTVAQDYAQIVDRETNTIEVRTSKFASVTVDRCVCSAVKLDLQNS